MGVPSKMALKRCYITEREQWVEVDGVCKDMSRVMRKESKIDLKEQEDSNFNSSLCGA